MSNLPKFQGFDKFFLANIEQFKHIYDSNQPQEEKMPDKWDNHLDEFEKMIFIKSFRPDKVVPCVQNWITN